MDATVPQYSFPPFDDLPPVPGQPQGCLWGFFDQDGKIDELGTLNLLTPAVVREAVAEVKTGRHIQLDWSLDNLTNPGFGRIPLYHKIKDLQEHGFVALDDEITINTQTSSQWDSLKHFGLQKHEMYYNGLTHKDAISTKRNGIHNMCDRGGIVGRGVLIDWLRWWEIQNPGKTPPSAISRHAIPCSELDEVLKFQGTVCRQGDILIVRTGFVKWHNESDTPIRVKGCNPPHEMIGVENSMSMVRWLYDKHFSAVAGDTMGFEAWPYPKDVVLHEWLLCLWGTPIGELWDLEELSQECDRQNRWTFLVTSAPLRVPGAVASPPNVIAIF